MRTKNTNSFQVKDHSVSQELFRLEYDDALDMWSTFPKPSVEKLPSYYESDAYISHTDASNSLRDKIYQGVKKYMLRYKLKTISNYSQGKRLLDVGAGTGDFLKIAKTDNWSVEGVEPSSKAEAIAKIKGISLKKELSEISGVFDVITMWHVLEHVYDLEKTIVALKNVLAEEGTLFIAVPNFKSYDAKKYGPEWAAYDVPRHLHHFSRKSIVKIFGKYEMKLVDTKPLIFDSFYVSILSEQFKENKLGFVRGLFTGLISNLSALRSNNYSSNIYILQRAKKPL